MREADYEFQRKEEEDLWDSLYELIVLALVAGAEAGVLKLPAEHREAVDWRMFDDAAESILNEYRLGVFVGISATSVKKINNIIRQWQREGGNDLQELLRRIEQRVYNEGRALLIAISEITRLYAIGSETIWATIGFVLRKEWVTAADDRVCPICRPLHGTRVSILSKFPNGLWNPPAHPGCRCEVKPALPGVA